MGSFRQIFLAFLRVSARIQLAKMAPKHIVGITGSAGKSSCKEAVIAVLKHRYLVKSGKPGFNSEFGLPMDILGIDFNYSSAIDLFLKSLIFIPLRLFFDWKRYEVLVFEMGVDSPTPPGDMGTLLQIVRPDIGVMLNVLPVHTAYFQKTGKESEKELVGRIADEKGKLITNLPTNGWAVINADDLNCVRIETKAKRITFGNGKLAQVKGFTFKTDKFIFNDDYKYTFAAAVAVGKALGISDNEAKLALEKNLILPPGRMSLLNGIKETTIIDSSYNSSRVPLMGALKTLAEFAGKRKIAVLGDMRELGDLARQEHEAVAREAVKMADTILTFGPQMEEFFVPEAEKQMRKKGARTKEIRAFRKMNELVAYTREYLQKGDTILVKGSQNTIFLERLVEAVLASPNDSRRLCRRGKMWDRKRAVSD